MQDKSATASGRCFTPKSCDPAVNDISCAAAAVIWVDVDSIRRTVFGAGTALHAGFLFDEQGFFAFNPEDTVGTDQFAVAAADAFLFRES